MKKDREEKLLNYSEEKFREVEAAARLYIDLLDDPGEKLEKLEALEENIKTLCEKRKAKKYAEDGVEETVVEYEDGVEEELVEDAEEGSIVENKEALEKESKAKLKK